MTIIYPSMKSTDLSRLKLLYPASGLGITVVKNVSAKRISGTIWERWLYRVSEHPWQTTGHLGKTLVQLSFNWNPWFCSKIKRINYFAGGRKNSIKNGETVDDRWIQRTKHTFAPVRRHWKLNVAVAIVLVDAGICRFPRTFEEIPRNFLHHPLDNIDSSAIMNFLRDFHVSTPAKLNR